MKGSLPVAWVTPRVRLWLAETGPVRFLHIFENSCSLKNSSGSVVSIVNPGIGRGPFNAVLHLPFDFPAKFTPETPAMLASNGLRLGCLHLVTDHAAEWDPAPDWHAAPIATALPDLIEALKHHGVQTEIRIHGIPDPDAQEAWLDLAHFLAGRGPGLTPAGDDYLVGLFHAVWSRFDRQLARQLCEKMAAVAVGRTTTLSGEWLRAAAAGEAGDAWHQLLHAIRAGEKAFIRRSAEGILQTGHSSGADALAGFIEGLQ